MQNNNLFNKKIKLFFKQVYKSQFYSQVSFYKNITIILIIIVFLLNFQIEKQYQMTLLTIFSLSCI